LESCSTSFPESPGSSNVPGQCWLASRKASSWVRTQRPPPV
jgi:hypothetical protein